MKTRVIIKSIKIIHISIMNANTRPIVPMFNFSTIPGAVIITGAEKKIFNEMLVVEPSEHPIYIAPEFNFYYTRLTVINIPVINFNDLINLLEGILVNTEKIEINRIKNWCYSIEFHPILGMKIYPNERAHKYKWWWMIKTVDKALEKYPDNESDFIPRQPFVSFENWFKMELRIYYSTEKDCYILEFNRMAGDAISFNKIYRQIKSQIESTLNTPTVLWLMRKNYINLFEGSQFSKNDENQITRYLLNDILLREICSYISVEEKTD